MILWRALGRVKLMAKIEPTRLCPHPRCILDAPHEGRPHSRSLFARAAQRGEAAPE